MLLARAIDAADAAIFPADAASYFAALSPRYHARRAARRSGADACALRMRCKRRARGMLLRLRLIFRFSHTHIAAIALRFIRFFAFA